jgi:hypothetical protein
MRAQLVEDVEPAHQFEARHIQLAADNRAGLLLLTRHPTAERVEQRARSSAVTDGRSPP